MTQSDTISYQERVVVTLDERLWNQSLQKAERDYQQFTQRLAKISKVQLQITAKDDASKAVDTLTKTTTALTRQSHTVTLAARDDASAVIRNVSTAATALGRRTTTLRVNVSDNATNQLRAISNSAGRLARGAISVPFQAAGNAASMLAPEIGGGVGMMAASAGAAGAVIGVGAAMGASAKNAMDYQTAIAQVRNNTTMTEGETATLSTNVLQLSNQFGLAKQPLIDAARQIQDLTQNADAMNGIMSVAAETAAATGADVSQTGNILASTLHQYKQDQGDVNTVQLNAAHAMGVLHLASAEGNMTMQQFADSSGRAVALAAQLGVPLEQVSAAMAALTRNGYDAAQSQTQVVNLFTHAINPAQAAEKQIIALSKATGVDLVTAYSATGVQTLGLTGIFQRTTSAYEKMGMTTAEATQETLKLLNAQRGGIGAALLMGKGASDFNNILSDLTNTEKTDTYVNQAWERSQATAGKQMEILGQEIDTASKQLGQNLLPGVLWGIDLLKRFAPLIGDTVGHLGDMIGPLLGASTPLDFFNNAANSAQDGLQKLNQWLGDFVTAVQGNGSFGILADAFGTINGQLGPLVDLLNPFREGIATSDAPTQALGTSADSAATAFRNMALGIKSAADEIAPLIDAIKKIEAFLNNVGKSGVGVHDAITGAYANGNQVNAAGRSAAGDLFSWLGTQANSATTAVGQGVAGAMSTRPSGIPTDAVNGMGGANLLTPEQTQAAVKAAQDHGAAVGQGLAQGVQDATPDVSKAATDMANSTSAATTNALDAHSPSRVFMAHGRSIVQGLAQGITDSSTTDLPSAVQAMVDQVKNTFQTAMTATSGIAYGTGAAGGDVSTWLTQAIGEVQKAGGSATADWLPGLQKLVGMESSGNPLAVNPTAVGGQHATGLLQTLPSTFQSNMLAGHNDINNPVDNAIAAIRYIQNTYGSVYNTPAFKGGTYQGYASGGWLSEPVFGVGSVSNKLYGFAEHGPEHVSARTSLLGGGGAVSGVAAGAFAPQFTIMQQPGQDGEALAQEVTTRISALIPDYLSRFAEHVGTALNNMPEESFG